MKRIAALTALGIFSVLSSPVGAESIYHWLDEHGKPVFSDRPPPATIGEPQQRRVYSGRAEQVPAYSVRRVAADFPVTLYIAEDCGAPCTEARQLLSGRGIPFAEHTITTDEDLEAFRAIFGPPDEVPAATIGPRQLRGFAPAAWNRLLDTVGYPRQAPPSQ